VLHRQGVASIQQVDDKLMTHLPVLVG